MKNVSIKSVIKICRELQDQYDKRLERYKEEFMNEEELTKDETFVETQNITLQYCGKTSCLFDIINELEKLEVK
tara:strand:+ start:262 stop:483 length:222 start_codon:yes stop_codon:yes gene_type:complete